MTVLLMRVRRRRRIDWVDLVDHAYAIWRGTLHGLGITDREWDPCEIDPSYTTFKDKTVLDPAFHLMRICPVCASHIGAPCTTADGKITGPHKRRREA